MLNGLLWSCSGHGAFRAPGSKNREMISSSCVLSQRMYFAVCFVKSECECLCQPFSSTEKITYRRNEYTTA